MDTLLLKDRLLVLALCSLLAGSAQARTERVASDLGRGQMLYSQHCVACHTEQVHWREQRLATDWRTLKGQVRRWAINTGLQWEESDVNEVASYLNRMYYDFPLNEVPRPIPARGSR